MVNGSVVRFGYSATSNPRPVLARHAMHDESQPGRGSARTRPSRDACHSRCKSYQDNVMYSLMLVQATRSQSTPYTIIRHLYNTIIHLNIIEQNVLYFLAQGTRHQRNTIAGCASPRPHAQADSPARARARGQAHSQALAWRRWRACARVGGRVRTFAREGARARACERASGRGRAFAREPTKILQCGLASRGLKC